MAKKFIIKSGGARQTIYNHIENGFNRLQKNNTSLDSQKTRWQGTNSENSYSFKTSKAEDILEIFSLNKVENIKDLFESAINGEGNEKLRIQVLHSSSLAAFLFFCNGNITIDNIPYNNVYFEITNKAIDINHPSSVDVVLVSNTARKVLFLECKFSEYILYCGKCNNISNSYRNSDEKLISNKIYEEIEKSSYLQIYNDSENTFSLSGKSGLKHYYCEGIKQLISHLVGLQKGPTDETKKRKLKIDEYDIELATVVFDFNDKRLSAYLEDYRKLYKEFAKIANCCNWDGRPIKVRSDILTYQDIFDKECNKNVLTDKVKAFYGFYGFE